MSADFRRVREVFLALRDLDDHARPAGLWELCGQDEALRAEVESLLAHHHRGARGDDDAARRLDGIVPAAAGALVGDPDPDRLGAFEILGRLGAGGMGIVYRARQQHPDRLVALKVLPPGAVSTQQAARFELEARVLARLQHKGIAQIFEAGAIDRGSGPQPYFAMELVEGAPLDAHVMDQDLGVRDRVALMARICDAVHHAHQKGIIHRDLKPGNILVTAAGEPKVLDFGVARATDGGRLSTNAQTVAGQLVGTLPYMSPEQVAGDPDALDLRSDVYALGVILFELLAGRLPQDLRDVAITEAARRIQQEPPPRLTSLRPGLSRDLETVVQAALEKDPDRRYASAAALADDLRRFLDDRPIQARPPSMVHQVRLFARRHRAVVAGTALAAVGLVAATVVSTGFAIEARRAARRAAHEQLVSERVNVHLEQMLRLPDAHRGGEEVTALELVDGVIRELDASQELPEVEATVRSSVGGTYLSLHRFEQAVEQLERADALWQGLGVEDQRRVETLTRLGGALSEVGRPADAVKAYRTVIALDGAAPLDDRQNLATALVRAGELDEAGLLFPEVVAARRARNDPGALAITLRNAAHLHTARGDLEQAAAHLEESLELGRAGRADDDPFYASAVLRLANIEQHLHGADVARPRLAEAWALTRDSRPVGSPDWMSTAAIYIRCLHMLDAREESVALLTDVAERLEAALGPEDYRTREAWGLLARRHDSWGETDRAAAIRAEHETSSGSRRPGGSDPHGGP